jgi:hypothetical protein
MILRNVAEPVSIPDFEAIILKGTGKIEDAASSGYLVIGLGVGYAPLRG